MLADRPAGKFQIVLRLGVALHLRRLLVQPGAHRIAAREHVGMALAVNSAAASAHGKAHYSTFALGPAAAVFLLHRRQEFLEKVILVAIARLIEIAVEGIVHVGAAGAWHHYHHGTRFARAHQLVCHDLHVTLVAPGGVVVAKAM